MISLSVFGMIGAAFVSLSAASLLRVFYLNQNMKLFPYRTTHLKCLAIGLLAFGLGKIIPIMDNFLIDLIIRCSATSIVYIGLCYLFDISSEMTIIGDKVIILFKKQWGRLFE